VRLRTDAGKRYKRVGHATALIGKILLVTEQRFRRLRAPHLLTAVAAGAQYIDGVEVRRDSGKAAA
jgi:hypothetical protein